MSPTDRLSQKELHQYVVESLGAAAVKAHSPLDSKPLEMDLAPPLPGRVRLYIYNATRPPGGRPLGEHKVQLIVPGQTRGQKGNFDHGDGRIVFLAGYTTEEDVFVFWDAGLYVDFAWSRNVQVKVETIIGATAGQLATQERRLRPVMGGSVVETVVAARADRLADLVVRRMDLTRRRMLREA